MAYEDSIRAKFEDVYNPTDQVQYAKKLRNYIADTKTGAPNNESNKKYYLNLPEEDNLPKDKRVFFFGSK
jgi:hypothetical protein